MANSIIRHDSFESDDDIKDIENKHREYVQEEDSNTVKRNRWIKIGVTSLLVTALLSIAIAVPVSMSQKNHKQQSVELHSVIVQDPTPSVALVNTSVDTNITAAAFNPEKHGNKKHKKHNNRLQLITDTQTSYQPPSYAHAISPYSNLTRLKTLTPPDEGRIFVMGDIHGCINEMNALLDKIEFKATEDVLILTGDLVFRGQDSVGVIRRARELNALCVRGNHDDKVVRFRGYQNKHGMDSMSSSKEIMPEGKVGDPLKFGNKHVDIAREMNEDDYNYLVGCPLILDIPELKARVVHGGLDPSIENLIDNDPWSVMNMRDINGDNEPSKSKLSKTKPSSSNIHWTSAYQSYSEVHQLNVTVYYGHDASRGINLETKTIGVDSGCVYGRKLSAIEIKSQQLFQVDCEKGGSGGDEEDDEDDIEHQHLTALENM